jgi:hypothetical protein
MTGPILFKKELIEDIRSKKELRNLDEEFVTKKLDLFLKNISHHQDKDKAIRKLNSSKTYKQFSKSSEHDFLIKTLRTELRKVYGAFILEDYEKKSKIVAKLRQDLTDDEESAIHLELLKLHKSTNERLNHYTTLYHTIFSKIFGDTEKKSYVILDLACGLNPISNIFFRDKIKKYYASDISSQDCDFLKTYFKKTKLDVEVFPMDLADEDNYRKLSEIKCDICFIFKTLDGLERVKRDITGNLLKAVDTKYFAITFPTLSLGGVREIKEHRRLWLEKLLDKLGWRWQKQLLENELLYFVEKFDEKK